MTGCIDFQKKFTHYDGVIYVSDYAIEPEPDLTVDRDATFVKYTSCDQGTVVQNITVHEGTHKPIYDKALYVATVSQFIKERRTRSFDPIADLEDGKHYEVNDNNASLVPLKTADLGGVAYVRNNGDDSYFVRVSFNAVARDTIESIELLDSGAASLGTAGTSVLYRTSLFAYATFKNISTVPSTIKVQVNGQSAEGTIVMGNPPAVLTAVFQENGQEIGTLEVSIIGHSRLHYSFSMPSVQDPTTVTSLSLKSAIKEFVLFPIPTGLPDPDDFMGTHTFWDYVASGGFKFEQDSTTGNHVVKGYAEDKSGIPYFYEEMTALPENYTVTLERTTGTLTTPLKQ